MRQQKCTWCDEMWWCIVTAYLYIYVLWQLISQNLRKCCLRTHIYDRTSSLSLCFRKSSTSCLVDNVYTHIYIICIHISPIIYIYIYISLFWFRTLLAKLVYNVKFNYLAFKVLIYIFFIFWVSNEYIGIVVFCIRDYITD